MRIKKTSLFFLKSVYSISTFTFNGDTFVIAGSEEKGGDLLIFSHKDFKTSKIVEGIGGFMTVLPFNLFTSPAIVTAEGLSPVFQSVNAGLSMYTCKSGSNLDWERIRIFDLPFIHRIAFVTASGNKTIIASSLCKIKETKDDWSSPGEVYSSVLKDPENPTDAEIKLIFSGITKNHGMYVQQRADGEVVYVSGDEGIFSSNVPVKNEMWQFDKILDKSVSDMIVYDIDRDGNDEIITIQPFHGDRACIYKNLKGQWRTVWDFQVNFGHVLWSGQIRGKSAIILGSRAAKKDLNLYLLENSRTWKFNRIIIEEGIGATQVRVLHGPQKDLVYSANNSKNEVALYEIIQ
jgi:hypothetical protein